MNKRFTRIFSLILALVMVVGMCPITARAEETASQPVSGSAMVGTWQSDFVFPAADFGVDAQDVVFRCDLAFAADGTVTADWTCVELTAIKLYFHQMFVSAYYACAYGAGYTTIEAVEEFCMSSTGKSVSDYMMAFLDSFDMNALFTPASTTGTYRISQDNTQLFLDMTLMGNVSDPSVPNACTSEGNTMYLKATSFGQDAYTFVCTRSTNEAIEGIGFLNNVVVYEESFDWGTSGDKIVVPADETVPQVGQILTFGTEKAIRVESVETANGQTLIGVSTPELYEFLDYIDLEGEATVNFGEFVPAEGVTVVSNESRGIMPLGLDDDFDIPATDIDTGFSTELELKVPLDDDMELAVAMEVAVPSVAFKLDVDFDMNPFNDIPAVLIKDAFAKMEKEITVSASLTSEMEDKVDDWKEKKVTIGSVPLLGIPKVGLELEIDLVVGIDGSVSLEYTVVGTSGIRIRNNRLENLTDLDTTAAITLAASAKAGMIFGIEAEIFGEEIMDIGIEAGLKGDGTATLRDTGLLCTDADVYVYAQINALEDCKIDDWLEIGVTFTIWDNENSPFSHNWHWEDLVKVDDCTYDNGTIRGTVANAEDHNQYIPGASIEIRNSDGELLARTVSDANGEYSAFVDEGLVTISTVAEGFIPLDSHEFVRARDTVYVNTYLMVEGDPEVDTGSIYGNIINAVTGEKIPGVQITIREKWNMPNSTVVTTLTSDDDGDYSVTLPVGYYTAYLEADGYASGNFTVSITPEGNEFHDAYLNPVLDAGDMRVIMSWLHEPRDLDSHMWGPMEDGSGYFHTCYYDRTFYYNGERAAFLDRDDTSYEGPETTTVYNMNTNGIYSFYVHDFTNQGEADSTVLANSGCKVEVTVGENSYTFHVPTSGTGDVWHVFDYDPTTGILTGVNTFSTVGSASNVGNPYGTATMSLEPFEKDVKDYAGIEE